jgi:hypothetical protein
MTYHKSAAQLTVNGMHSRVARERGKAKLYPCYDECGRQANDWATIHGRNGLSIDDYIPLCRSCHVRYDRSYEDLAAIAVRNGKANKGRLRPDVTTRNKGNHYARPCPTGCRCGKHRKAA